MRFTKEPGDIAATDLYGRELVAHPDGSQDGIIGISLVSTGGHQVAVAWVRKQDLVSWASEIVRTYE